MSNQLAPKTPGEQFVDSVFTPSRMDIVAEACSGNRFVTPDKVRATIAEAMIREPKLAEAYPPSVFQSALLAARLDLDASGYHNGAAFVVRWNSREKRSECNLQMGYGAMVDLATRDGRIQSFTVQEVYDCDEFEYKLGTQRFINHIPANERPEKAKLTHCYAIAWFPGGGYEFEVMTRKDIEYIRDTYTAKYKDGNIISPAWKYSFGRMGCKTVLNRLIKRLPVNPVLAEAIERSHVADGMDSFNPRRMAVANTSMEEAGNSIAGMLDADIDDDEPERDPDTGEVIPDEVDSTDLFEGEGAERGYN